MNAKALAYVPRQVTSQPVLVNSRLASLVTQPSRAEDQPTDVSHAADDTVEDGLTNFTCVCCSVTGHSFQVVLL